MTRDELPDVLTPEDVRRFLRVGRGAAYRLMRQPGFPAVRLPGGWRVSKEAFLRWLEGGGEHRAGTAAAVHRAGQGAALHLAYLHLHPRARTRPAGRGGA